LEWCQLVLRIQECERSTTHHNPFTFPESAVAWFDGGRMEDKTTEGVSVVLAAIIIGLLAAVALVAWVSME